MDTACTLEQRDAIVRAVASFNAVWDECHDDTGIDLVGMVTIRDYGSIDEPESKCRVDPADVIACVPEEEEYLFSSYPETVKGMSARTRNIIMFPARIPDGLFFRVVLHELGHYRGLHHVDEPDSVMYGLSHQDGNVQVDEWSASDKERICEL